MASDGGGAEQQVIVRLVSELPELQVADEPLEIPAKLTRFGLSELVNHLLARSPPIPFDFLVEGELLRTSLRKLMLLRSISGESAVELRYFPMLQEPEQAVERPHEDWVSALHSRGRLVSTGSYDGVVRIWDGERVHALIPAHGAPVKAVALLAAAHGAAGGALADDADGDAFGADGEGSVLVASASQDGTVRAWAVDARGESVAAGVCAGHEGSVNALAAAAAPGGGGGGGARLASGGWDGTVRLWELGARAGGAAAEAAAHAGATPRERKRARKPEPAAPPPLAASAVLRGHTLPVSGVAWAGAEPGGRLLSCSWDGSVRQWDVLGAQCVASVGSVKGALALSAAHADPTRVATAHDNGAVQLWDLRAKPSEAATARLAAHDGWASAVAFCAAAEHQLLSAGHDGAVKLWDARGRLPLHTLAEHADKVLCTGWGGADGRKILSGGADCKLLARALPPAHAESLAQSR